MRSYQRVGSSDETLSRVETNIEDAIRPIANTKILDGKLVEGVLTEGVSEAVEFPHGLGRDYKGVILCSVLLTDQSDAILTINELNPSDKSRYIKLMLTSPSLGTQTANVKVWVF
jgi:hypothetical protein